ncbi:M23 family metallopeptidase [Salmonella enterica]
MVTAPTTRHIKINLALDDFDLQLVSVRDPLVRNVVNRLVVRQHSEWYGGCSTGRWEGFYEDLESQITPFCEKWQADLEWMSGVVPFNEDKPVWHFHPVVFLDALSKKKLSRIIFPLKIKPSNDKDGKWKNYYWAAALTDRNASQAIFGRNRNNGNRKHAARDLYTEPKAEVVSVCNGIVRNISHYYYSTWQVTVEHTTTDGHHFYARYGEVDPTSILVKVNDHIIQGKIIAKTGLLIEPGTGRHIVVIPK